MSTQTYTVLLLKDTVTKFEDALDEEKEINAYPLIPAFGLVGTLFVGQQNQSTPDWVKLLTPYIQNPVKSAFTANISAVLMLKYEGRIFAFSFGHGKNLLVAASWVRDFGLKVTLNRVDPEKLRSEVDPENWTGRIVNANSAQRSPCQRNDVSIVPI